METNEGPTRLRTSDKEREEVVAILRAAMAEGRLTMEEGEERMAAGYAAKYRDELGPLLTDLPGYAPSGGAAGDGQAAQGWAGPGGVMVGPGAGGPQWGSGAGSSQWGAGMAGPQWGPGGHGSQWRPGAHGVAWGPGGRGRRGGYPTRRSVGRHAGFVLVLATLLTGVWALSGAHFFWPLFPIAFLLIGLFRHAAWAGAVRRATGPEAVAPWNRA